MTTTICPWCGEPFTATVRGGNAKKFCSPAHKHAFETAARRYAYAMHEAGLLTVEQMKQVSTSRATPGEAKAPSEAAE